MANRTDDRRRSVIDGVVTYTQDVLDEAALYGIVNLFPMAYITKADPNSSPDPIGISIALSDRPIADIASDDSYGSDYGVPRGEFSVLKRTLGEPLNPAVQLSTAEVTLNNIDGRYNFLLEGGEKFISFSGADIRIDIANNVIVFKGLVKKEDPISIDQETIKIRGEGDAVDINRITNLPVINKTDFPSAPDESLGKVIPYVLGDWNAGYNPYDPLITILFQVGKIQVRDIVDDVFKPVDLDSLVNAYGGIIGYNVGGNYFVFSIGSYNPGDIEFAHIKRGNDYLAIAKSSTAVNTAGYWSVKVNSYYSFGSGFFPYYYQSGDILVISVVVPYSGTDHSNVIDIVEHMITDLAGLDPSVIDTVSFNEMRNRTSLSHPDCPISEMYARIWIGDNDKTVQHHIAQLLEQFRIEMYVDNNTGKLKLTGINYSNLKSPTDMDAQIIQADMVEDSFSVDVDEKLFFNILQLNYSYSPRDNKTYRRTLRKKNQKSITISGNAVEKVIDCPNIYREADAAILHTQYLKLYSAGLAYMSFTTSWRHIHRNLGDYVSVSYIQGSLHYVNVPTMIRDISIDMKSMSVTFKVLSFANFAYDNGAFGSYLPENRARFLSSYDATISNA